MFSPFLRHLASTASSLDDLLMIFRVVVEYLLEVNSIHATGEYAWRTYHTSMLV